MYRAQVDPEHVMNTMIAKLSTENIKAKARIFRLTQILDTASMFNTRDHSFRHQNCDPPLLLAMGDREKPILV